MEFLRYSLILISTLGYADLVGRRLRLPFSCALPVALALQVLIMFFAGFVRIPAVASWIMLGCGLLAAVCRMRTDGRAALRKEHLFIVLVLALLFLRLRSCSFDDWSPDFIECWYGNFLYQMLNGRWPDSGFVNYAHAYCMICNGYACFVANIVGDMGMWVYSFSMLSLTVGAFLPIFAFARWRTLPVSVVLSCVLVVVAKVCDIRLLLALPVLLFPLAVRAVRLHRVREASVRALLFLVLSSSLAVLVSASHPDVSAYPMDALLSAFTCAVFVMTFKLAAGRPGARRNRIFAAILPCLFVLTLIKPTGVIPALFFSGVIAVHLMRRGRAAVAAILVLLVPLLAFAGWAGYCRCQGWSSHMRAEPQRMVRHLTHGVSGEEFVCLREKIGPESNGLSISGEGCAGKSWPLVALERILKRLWPAGVGESRPEQVNQLACVLLLVIFAAVVTGIGRSVRRKGLCLLTMGGAFYSLVMFNQFFITPMYTNIPVLFRYVVYAFSTVWVVALVLLCLLCRPGRAGISLSAVLVFAWLFVHPLCARTVLCDRPKTSTCRGLAAAVMMMRCAAGDRQVFASQRPLNNMPVLLKEAGLLDSTNRLCRKIVDVDQSDCIMFYTGKVSAERMVGRRRIRGKFGAPGFYYARLAGVRELDFVPLYCNPDAIRLAERAYTDKDMRMNGGRPAVCFKLGSSGLAHRRFYHFADDRFEIRGEGERVVSRNLEMTDLEICHYEGEHVCCRERLPLKVGTGGGGQATFCADLETRTFACSNSSEYCSFALVTRPDGKAVPVRDVEIRQFVSAAVDLTRRKNGGER